MTLEKYTTTWVDINQVEETLRTVNRSVHFQQEELAALAQFFLNKEELLTLNSLVEVIEPAELTAKLRAAGSRSRWYVPCNREFYPYALFSTQIITSLQADSRQLFLCSELQNIIVYNPGDSEKCESK